MYRSSKSDVSAKADKKAPSDAIASDSWRRVVSTSEKGKPAEPKPTDLDVSSVTKRPWTNSKMRTSSKPPASAGAGSTDDVKPVFTGLIIENAMPASRIYQAKADQFKKIINAAIDSNFAMVKADKADALRLKLERQYDIGLIDVVIDYRAETIKKTDIDSQAEAIDASVLSLLVEKLDSNYEDLSAFILNSAFPSLDKDIVIKTTKNFEIAHDLFTKAINEGSATLNTYIAYINAALTAKEFDIAEEVYKAAYSREEFRTTDLFNVRLGLLRKRKQWEEIRALFTSPDLHGYKGMEFDAVSYLQRIYAEQDADNKSIDISKDTVHKLYHSADRAGIHHPKLDCRYMGSLAKLKPGKVELGMIKSIMGRYAEENLPTAELYQYANYLLQKIAGNRYLRSEAFELATYYYQKAKEANLINITHYFDYINFCKYEDKKSTRAIDVFKDAMSRGVNHDKLFRSLISLANNFSKLKELKDESLKILEEGDWPELCKSMLLAAYQKDNEDQVFADEIYKLMKDKPTLATEVAYSTYIQKTSSYDKALAAYEWQKEQGLKYNLYSALIIAAMKHEKFPESVEWMEEAAKHNQLDERGFGAYIAQAGKKDQLELARMIYDKAISSDGASSFGDAVHIAMIEVYHRHSEFDAALGVFHRHFAGITEPSHPRNKKAYIDFHDFKRGTTDTACHYLFSQGTKWNIIVGRGSGSKNDNPDESTVRTAVRDFMEKNGIECKPERYNDGVFICTKPAAAIDAAVHEPIVPSAANTAGIFASPKVSKALDVSGVDYRV